MNRYRMPWSIKLCCNQALMQNISGRTLPIWRISYYNASSSQTPPLSQHDKPNLAKRREFFMSERVGAHIQNCRNAATFSRNPCLTCNATLRFLLRISSVKDSQSSYPQHLFCRHESATPSAMPCLDCCVLQTFSGEQRYVCMRFKQEKNKVLDKFQQKLYCEPIYNIYI